MLYKLSEYPQNTLPRERLAKFGPSALADYEILAIILRTGTREQSVLDLSKELLIKYRSLSNFNSLSLEELKDNKGIKEAKAIELLAAIEFGKRVFNTKREMLCIKTPDDLYEYLRFEMENLLVEEMRCVYLNVKGGVIDIIKLGMGNTNKTEVDFREVVKWALKLSSQNFIIVHNHPSGNCNPSHNDKVFTNELSKYASFMGVNLIDHLIIGKNAYYSFSRGKEF